jgi:hypothetical protein
MTCSILFGLAGLAGLAFAQPSVSVNPRSGPPTDNVTIGGAGFGPSESVDIYFDTADLALAATSPAGAFSGIRLAIPASATPGPHSITAVGRQSGLGAQASFLVRADWPEFRGGPERQGYNPTENVLNSSNVVGMEVRWIAALGSPGPTMGSPAAAGGMVYLPSFNGILQAFRATTGQPVWSAATGGIDNSPAVAHGVAYVGAYLGLYAFHAAT